MSAVLVVLEESAELVERVPVHVLADVDIDQLRGDRGAVAEDVLYLVERHAQGVEKRRARVAQIVEPDTPDAGQLAPRLEVPVDVARLDRRAMS